MKMEKQISRILKYGTIISCYCLIGSVLLQIFARFFLETTPSWTEEASRLFFLYTMAFAAGLALKTNEYVYLEYFVDKFSKEVRRRIIIAGQFVTIALFAVMSYYAIEFFILGTYESSSSMKINMSVAFFTMFLLSISMTYYGCLDLKRSLSKRNKKAN